MATLKKRPDDDPLEPLINGLPAGRQDLSRRLTTAMRLFASDTQGHGSTSMGVHVGSAGAEYERHSTAKLQQCIEDLCAHVTRTMLHVETMLCVPLQVNTYSGGWSSVLRMTSIKTREELGLDLPAPELGPDDVLDRLIASLERLLRDGSEDAHARVVLWRARQTLVRHWIQQSARSGTQASPRPGRSGDVALTGDDYARTQDALASAYASLTASTSSAGAARRRSLGRSVLCTQIAMAIDARRHADVVDLAQRMPAKSKLIGECASAEDALLSLARWFGPRDGPFPRLSVERARSLGLRAAPWCEISAWVEASEGGHLLLPPGSEPLEWEPLEPESTAPDSTAPDTTGAGDPAVQVTALDRKRLGARALVLCALDPRTGVARVVDASVAPALRSALKPWSTKRRLAVTEPGTPEHEAVRSGLSFVLSRASEGADIRRQLARCGLASATGRACGGTVGSVGFGPSDLPSARSILVEPVLSREGDAIGFAWIEADHDLIPSALQRSVLADLCRRRIEASSFDLSGVSPAEQVDWPIEWNDEVLARRWARIVESLQVKFAERRWVAFHRTLDRSGAPRPVAVGGSGDLGDVRPFGMRVIQRALQTGGAVLYDSPGRAATDEPGADGIQVNSTLFERARCGAALPVRLGADIVAVLCIESGRRGDVRARDVRRWHEALGLRASDVAATLLDERDRLAGYGGVALDTADPDAQLWLDRVGRLGLSNCDVLVYGEVGSGRATMARAIAHRDQLVLSRGRLYACKGAAISNRRIVRRFGGSAGDSVVVSDIDRLTALDLDALRVWSSEDAALRPRLLMTAGVSSGAELARSFGCATSRATALRERRQSIPALADGLVSRAVWREGLAPLELEDAAAAHLWRQDWPGNATELSAVLNTAVCGRSGESLDLESVLTAMEDCGLTSTHKLASREPDEVAFAGALWVTRTASNRVNKSRAALYLGWDPATVAAKMRSLGIDGTAEAARRMLRPASPLSDLAGPSLGDPDGRDPASAAH